MKKLLIFYSHFSPAFKAGGPVQSLVNLVGELYKQYEIYVICSAFEMGETEILSGIVPNQWNDYEGKAKVFYVHKFPIHSINSAIKSVKPDIIYVNGIFLLVYTIVPVLLALINRIPVFVAPRGMLQAGALSAKNRKKRIFLFLTRRLVFHKNIVWHATDSQEQNDIFLNFGLEAKVKIVPNFPRFAIARHEGRSKAVGELRMVFLSVIGSKKNLDMVLSALKEIEGNVVFDIYGPIKEKAYWEKCQALMRGHRHEIRYLGAVKPFDVPRILSKYHVFVLPTKGENFGHAIFESFSVGTPAIISAFTPWGHLQSNECGFTIERIDQGLLKQAIDEFIDMNETRWSKMSIQAYKFASGYVDRGRVKEDYIDLFATGAG